MDNMLVHEFALAWSASGDIVTFEKIPTCILMQSCHSADTPLEVLLRLRDGDDRKRLDTLKTIMNDSQPKDKTIQDIISWIFDGGELAEKYNLFDSNCQQFVMNLWQRFSSLPFPNPSKFSDTQPLIKRPAVDMAKRKENYEKQARMFNFYF